VSGNLKPALDRAVVRSLRAGVHPLAIAGNGPGALTLGLRAVSGRK
jgi:hypothetical protein